MGKTLLIHTLGNRDWQFGPNIGSDLINSLLEPNKENKFMKVPISPFRDSTQKLKEIFYQNNTIDYQALCKSHDFPMLQSACEFVLKREEKVDVLWLIATDQIHLHPSDTLHLAPIAKAVIMDRFTTFGEEKRIKDCQINYLPWNLGLNETAPKLYAFFHAALKLKYKEGFDTFYFSCEAGVPDVTHVIKVLAFREANCVFLKHKLNKGDGSTYTEDIHRMPNEFETWKES